MPNRLLLRDVGGLLLLVLGTALIAWGGWMAVDAGLGWLVALLGGAVALRVGWLLASYEPSADT